MDNRERLIVVGNGMAGARLVEDILARGGADKFEIVMFGDEPYGNYNRILLSNVLSGSHDPKDIFINPLSWYQENNIKLHAGIRVTNIDREAKKVYGTNEIVEEYDKLVIATGSSAFVPPMEGLSNDTDGFKKGIFVFRTLDDCDNIIKYAENAKRAVVIGGGLLGLEAARGLLNMGLEVHVVHLMQHLMEVQLDRPAGEVLQHTLEKMGVTIHLEKLTTSILGNGHVTGVAFKDGTTMDCDMVVISAGIRPNTQLAKIAGLKVERGIVVGDDLSCPDDPNIFAVGECAQHRGQVYGLVAPLWEQTQILADRLTGRNIDAAYLGSKVSTKLKVMGVELAAMGEKEAKSSEDEVVSYVEPTRGIYKKLIIRNNRLAGAILLGDSSTAANLLQMFDRGTEVPDNRAEMLFQISSDSNRTMTMAYVPDSTQICNCNGVSKGDLLAAIKNGCRSIKSLCEKTRAGMGCGSCKPQVEGILELACDGMVTEDPSAHYYVPGVPLTKPELIKAIKEKNLRSVSAVFSSLANGKEDPGSKAGLASLLKTIWGKDYEDERDARFINDRVHANIQKDRTFSVVPRIYGGVTSAAELRRIADVADKYNVPMVKITGGQRIDLLGIPKEKLPDVWRDLGMPSGHAYTKSFRTCKTCVGSEFCRYGLGDSTGLGIQIERKYQGLESPHKMKLATAGCPRNCSEATTKDLGAVAIEGGRWEIYIGGAAGSRVRKGDVLVTVDTHEEVLKYMGRFMQYYREHGKYLERTYDLVERIGIEKLKRILVDDEEGICEQLDKDIEAAVSAYVDPWLEAEQPVHPTQFTNIVGTLQHNPDLVPLSSSVEN
jgi:nitrite reductase (NADH) large subunit